MPFNSHRFTLTASAYSVSDLLTPSNYNRVIRFQQNYVILDTHRKQQKLLFEATYYLECKPTANKFLSTYLNHAVAKLQYPGIPFALCSLIICSLLNIVICNLISIACNIQTCTIGTYSITALQRMINYRASNLSYCPSFPASRYINSVLHYAIVTHTHS